MSSPKRGTITLLLILSFTILSLNLPNSLAWIPTEITSNPNNGDPPTIDGILDESWNTIGNYSFHSFPGGRGITLYVQHIKDSIYFLVEVKFVSTAYNTETISLFLSNSTNETETDQIFDKKQITLFNATIQGNESSTYSDYYLGNEGLYLPDSYDEGFEGAAKIGNETDIHRYYEFKIAYQPSTENSTEDSSIKIFEKISIKIGINNTASEETISEAISIQIGPKGISIGEEIPGEFDFNTELYMMIVLISVSVIFGIYGIILISFRAKNPQNKFMEGE